MTHAYSSPQTSGKRAQRQDVVICRNALMQGTGNPDPTVTGNTLRLSTSCNIVTSASLAEALLQQAWNLLGATPKKWGLLKGVGPECSLHAAVEDTERELLT